MKCIVLGGVSVDSIIKISDLNGLNGDNMRVANDAFEMIGGTGAGKALALANLGFEVVFYGLIGKDEAGQKVIDYFNATQVDFRPIYTSASTGIHTNIMYENDKRLTIFHSLNQGEYTFPKEDIKNEAKDACMVFANILEYVIKEADFINTLNKPVFVDIHDYDGANEYHKPLIKIADYISMSNVNIANPKKYAESLIENGTKLVAITKSKDGAEVINAKGEWFSSNIRPCKKFVDSNGAGDNFSAGLIFGILNEYSLETALLYGAVMGSFACETKEITNRSISLEMLKTECEKYR